MLLQHNQRNFQSRLVEGLQLAQTPKPAFLILDGQQRLTSLFMTLLSNNPVLIDRGKRYQLEKRWFYLDIVKITKRSRLPDICLQQPQDLRTELFRFTDLVLCCIKL